MEAAMEIALSTFLSVLSLGMIHLYLVMMAWQVE
jgi:hypothetical protein